MMEWVQSLPIVPAVAFLYMVILLRAGGTYALGRGARRAADRGRVADWLAAPRVSRASEIVNTWGAPVVAFSFLTVGFQTAVNAAAGLTGMPLRRYLPALAVGGFAWAIIYATVGLVAIMGWFELFMRSPWAAVTALAIVAVLVVALIRHRRRGRDSLLPAEDAIEPADPTAVTGPGTGGTGTARPTPDEPGTARPTPDESVAAEPSPDRTVPHPD